MRAVLPVGASVLAAVAVALSAFALAGLGVLATDDLILTVAFAVIGGLCAAIGIPVAWRERRNPVGIGLTLVGVLAAFVGARIVWYALLTHRPESWDATPFGLAVAREAGVWLLIATALVVLYFPDGRLPTRRWSWLPIVLLLAGVVTHALGFIEPEQDVPVDLYPPLIASVPAWYPIVSVLSLLLIFGGLIGVVVAVVVRFRRSHGKARQQLKWVALAGCLFLVYPIGCFAEIMLNGEPTWASMSVGLVSLIALPVAIGIAMLRYNLYDIDRALSTTITYGATLVVLGALFGGIVASVGAVLGAESAPVAAVATAICALLLLPVSRWIRRLVDRRLYPVRRTAIDAIDALQRQVNAGTTQPEVLQDRLSTALDDPGVRVGYLAPSGTAFVTSDGKTVDDVEATPINVAGEQVGVLVAPTISASLCRQLATASAMLVGMVRLRVQLTETLGEVERSRARIIKAEDEARRRLERDLHDGAQQRLVSLGMSLRLAQRHIGEPGFDVDGVLDAGVAELSTAIAELRAIAHGIRPAALDEGLREALTSLARSVPIPVELRVTDREIPEAVATTVFYIVAESLANVIKHARAKSIAVTVIEQSERLLVRVEDDGSGGADAGRGTGITGLVDRVSAAGGSLSLISEPGRGTVVEAVLPCA